ncbi:TRIC cation channel family protein [Leucobacter sp. gxy201]|uniref:trimeric intracellular cation channel family protein n=1 Tax=Leucobacter sp. gxy201 TaxID=2957200 RepID=UPI003DA087BD
MFETFKIPLAADLIAVGTGSLQGAVFAAGFRRLDLLGVALIGVVCGIGGGFLRDILLGISPAAFTNNFYLLVAVGSALVGMMLPRLFRRLDPLVNLLDAISIGMFGAIGTTKALSAGLPVVPALFIGTIAAVGGGALRDVMLNLPIAVMHVGSLYAAAALAGVSVLTVLLALGVPVVAAGIVCTVVTAVMRMLSVKFGWSLPEQRALSRLKLRKQRQVEEVIEEALQTGTITMPITIPGLDLDDLDDLDGLGEPGGDDSDDEGRGRRRRRRPE